MQGIQQVAQVPVLFLSAYGRDEGISRTFEAGAIEYMVKPFSPTELVARIRSAMRRQMAPVHAESLEPFVLGDLTVNYAGRVLSTAERRVHLAPIEYDLLVELSVNAGRVLTYDALLNRVWARPIAGGKSAVRTSVKRLRDKLGRERLLRSVARYIPSSTRRRRKRGTCWP